MRAGALATMLLVSASAPALAKPPRVSALVGASHFTRLGPTIVTAAEDSRWGDSFGGAIDAHLTRGLYLGAEAASSRKHVENQFFLGRFPGYQVFLAPRPSEIRMIPLTVKLGIEPWRRGPVVPYLEAGLGTVRVFQDFEPSTYVDPPHVRSAWHPLLSAAAGVRIGRGRVGGAAGAGYSKVTTTHSVLSFGDQDLSHWRFSVGLWWAPGSARTRHP